MYFRGWEPRTIHMRLVRHTYHINDLTFTMYQFRAKDKNTDLPYPSLDKTSIKHKINNYMVLIFEKKYSRCIDEPMVYAIQERVHPRY